MNQIIGFYFPEGITPNEARAKFSNVAKKLGFGPGELIAAIGEGRVGLALTGEAIAQTDLTQMPLIGLLATAAERVDSPQLAAELKRRIRVLNEAGL